MISCNKIIIIICWVLYIVTNILINVHILSSKLSHWRETKNLTKVGSLFNEYCKHYSNLLNVFQICVN